MPHLALSAIGRDRPGIVAAVTGVLLRHGVNVEDSQMAILRGHFSMTLVLGVPQEADQDALRSDLTAVAEDLGLGAMSLSEIEASDAPQAEPSHIVTVYGADHPGIVHAAAEAVAARGWSITDLNTRLAGDPEAEALYALMMEVAVPAGDGPALEETMEAVAEAQQVEVSVRELEDDEL